MQYIGNDNRTYHHSTDQKERLKSIRIYNCFNTALESIYPNQSDCREIEARCRSKGTRKNEKRRTCLIGNHSKTIFQVFVYGGNIQAIIKRHEYLSNYNISKNVAQNDLEIRHSFCEYLPWNRDKRDARQRGTNHSKSDQIPRTLFISGKKRLRICIARCDPRDEDQHREIRN